MKKTDLIAQLSKKQDLTDYPTTQAGRPNLDDLSNALATHKETYALIAKNETKRSTTFALSLAGIAGSYFAAPALVPFLAPVAASIYLWSAYQNHKQGKLEDVNKLLEKIHQHEALDKTSYLKAELTEDYAALSTQRLQSDDYYRTSESPLNSFKLLQHQLGLRISLFLEEISLHHLSDDLLRDLSTALTSETPEAPNHQKTLLDARPIIQQLTETHLERGTLLQEHTDATIAEHLERVKTGAKIKHDFSKNYDFGIVPGNNYLLDNQINVTTGETHKSMQARKYIQKISEILQKKTIPSPAKQQRLTL